MGERHKQNPLKVSVAVGFPGPKLHLELGDMLLEVFSASGFQSSLVRDGDSDALKADLLLLIGGCDRFKAFAQLLSDWDERKPTTIIWNLNPLPPTALSEDAEQTGLRAVEMWDRMTLPPGLFSRLIKSVVPMSVRSGVRRVIERALFLGSKKEMANNRAQVFRELDISTARNMMRQYRWLKRYILEGWIDYVFVSSIPQMEFLASRGIPAEFTPVGYHPGMGENLGIARDIDVVFLGNLRYTRRQATLNALRRNLESRGIDLLAVEGECYGRERTELLNRASISLNLVKYPSDLPGVRFLMSMGCGALVVSEPLDNPTPYKVGEHFVQGSVTDLPDVIVHYLENKAEREKIVHSAHNFVTRELTMHNMIKQIMGVCGADSPLPASDMRRGH